MGSNAKKFKEFCLRVDNAGYTMSQPQLVHLIQTLSLDMFGWYDAWVASYMAKTVAWKAFTGFMG